jgi:clan AA aspartic protease (TIGR02281 family)
MSVLPGKKPVHRQAKATQKLANAFRVGLLIAASIYFLAHFDLTSLVFPRWNESGQSANRSQIRVESRKEVAQTIPETLSQQPMQPPVKHVEEEADSFYTYTDEMGVIHMVNDLDKVPMKHRNHMKVTRPSAPRGNITPVIINGNKVLVPVTLSFHGRSVETRLLLDTGASVTTISGQMATRLGVDALEVRAGKATVADGRSARAYEFVSDSLTVGSQTQYDVRTSILPGSGGEGYDGLLGMDFLKNYRYHVDFDRNVIYWGA